MVLGYWWMDMRVNVVVSGGLGDYIGGYEVRIMDYKWSGYIL